ncbi:MAG: biotin--[acetyl-CoA-carboxylase] ligase [Elusimicrobia bacterium CG_4_9_14_3_um_filter_62_55]|nr:MAG: biotin--[acetyl-CoA-carboxylase] ligase [Elusimicrobia bacterium CG22_combo_CG10-13_8_21_14_all_63_91]PJA17457.1 MAG: biotin--[acetyl-CoA-carboxylase] ligase [Elusimicrobia bacterium CG_4_10_14_0_2_um_filter_63_34]PJB25471.1 MAG: biotin--[acetyl-CoA-carboxylase] ligase [Elusimicrobia bacterium CG_4_9_14_3_um_filter_62_55]
MKRIHRFKSIPSTQTRSRVLAQAGAPAWTVVRADRQSAGRGRMDRRFSSGPGGLYFTVLLRPRMSPPDLARFSLNTGRLMTKTVGALAGIKTKVKEPNDVLGLCADGRWRKVAGILIEASGGRSSLDWVAIGVGVNVNNAVPRSLPDAASLASIACRPIPLEAFYRGLMRSLKEAWRGL